jgi:hypothetical protein
MNDGQLATIERNNNNNNENVLTDLYIHSFETMAALLEYVDFSKQSLWREIRP